MKKQNDIDVKSLKWFDDSFAFFANGHLDKTVFLEAAKPVIDFELGRDADPVTEANVQHTWFRMMSPTEAKRQGYDYGYMQVREDPGKPRRGGPWAVTLLVV
jgi:hypothetical protein